MMRMSLAIISLSTEIRPTVQHQGLSVHHSLMLSRIAVEKEKTRKHSYPTISPTSLVENWFAKAASQLCLHGKKSSKS